MCARALALWCALALCAGAAAYTVDCNHEYADCDNELSKLSADLYDTTSAVSTVKSATEKATIIPIPTSTTQVPTRTTLPPDVNKTQYVTEVTTTTEEVSTESPKPQPRLLNLNVDDLKNFAIALHNETLNTKKLTDLSDVNLDGEDDEEALPKMEVMKHNKDVSDKFFSNLQAPFNPALIVGSDEAKEDEMCKENEIFYKVGERIERGCEETCECTNSGVFDCSPRCKHPYIRRGRRLNDPLCFESPVDECCSIIACATGNGDVKAAKVEVCRYGNETHIVGSNWEIGCEQTCSCEKNSVVTCKPRCKPLPQSDKCINVQDPNDVCCEVQVCDVSQDVHEEPLDNSTSTTTTTTERPFKLASDVLTTSVRPLVLTEPIGSVKVLQNNSVQVNLMQVNNSLDPVHLLLSSDGGQNFKDVELKFDNLILNLDGGKDYILKTKETGTKFNFTITTSDFESKEADGPQEVNKKIGCHQDGKFYEVGEEFHIGCSELCECTGAETRECAALECPSHVGLELVSKGCVRWAPSPPPQPPNCCPRAARCLSDGTCYFNGVAIPNWTEVPLSLTGCQQRCFCENGDLDCQEVCTPLAPIPPQNFRCPPQHRPAPVNISDEDCCKHWGCVPNAWNTSHSQTNPTVGNANFVTPVTPVTSELGVISLHNANIPVNFYKHLSPVNAVPRLFKTFSPTFKNFVTETSEETRAESNNATAFSIEDTQYSLPQIPIIDKSNEMVNKNQFNIYEHPVATANNEYIFPPKPETSKKYSAAVDSYEMPDRAIQKNMYDTLPINHHINAKFLHKHVHEPVIKNERQQYFEPHEIKFGPVHTGNVFKYKGNSVNNQAAIPYFKPVAKNYSRNQPQQVNVPQPNYSKQNLPLINVQPKYAPRKHAKVLPSKEFQTLRLTDKNWPTQTDMHVLKKLPNPYETVLMRALPNPRHDIIPLHEQRNTPLTKTYSTLELEHLLNQMEVESEVNRNLERSADKNQRAVAGSPPGEFGGAPSLPHHQPPFLPTIPPENFPPDETTIEYERNNDHQPVNPILPALPGLPPGLPMQPGRGDENKKLTVISLLSDSPTSVKMLFGLPPVLVGLRGSVDLRYTDKPDEEISHWYSQVFAPADEILTTSRLEFRLTGLKPATVYKVRGKLYLHNLPVEPESEIYSIRTLEIPTVAPIEEKRREINSRLTLLDVNDTVAHVSWRRFTEDELQYIDGIQVRYRPVGTPIYSMTELLHHSRAAASLHELRAGSRYEASLVLVPPPRATIELVDHTVLEFTTTPLVDPYDWSVSVEARSVGSEAAELTWRGIPSPAERWVRVYRAAHACGAIRKEHDAFRLATREMPSGMTLTGLEPNARCRVWLELFLSNGKVKTSNVLEINTKSLDSPEPIDNVIEASSVGGRNSPRGDYYGALVAVGVVAALGALTSLLLLLVVVRRHRPRSVPITPVPTAPRESSLPPYDNPAYKLELQQETMDL